jgi:hypothetical protein
MKWLDNAYCEDNDYFTSGVYGEFEGPDHVVRYPAYYAGQELGKFLEVAAAKFAIELAHSSRTKQPMPVRIRLGPVDHTRSLR